MGSIILLISEAVDILIRSFTSRQDCRSIQTRTGITLKRIYVFVAFTDFDCDGNLLSGETTCQVFVPSGVVEINPFRNAFVVADVELECSDGINRHLTTNNPDVPAEGFMTM